MPAKEVIDRIGKPNLKMLIDTLRRRFQSIGPLESFLVDLDEGFRMILDTTEKRESPDGGRFRAAQRSAFRTART
jgi:hypothetical protein